MKMVWRFSTIGAIVTAAATAGLITGCASSGPITKEQANYPVNRIDAQGLFLENCATCHGKDGRAKTFHGRLVGAQNLTDPTFQTDTSNEEIRHAIMTGPKAMPSFKDKLSPNEIDALVDYVRGFGSGS